jgi:hypothetical protein
MSRYGFKPKGRGYNVYRTRSGSSPRKRSSSGSAGYGFADALAKGIMSALFGKRRKR